MNMKLKMQKNKNLYVMKYNSKRVIFMQYQTENMEDSCWFQDDHEPIRIKKFHFNFILFTPKSLKVSFFEMTASIIVRLAHRTVISAYTVLEMKNIKVKLQSLDTETFFLS